MDCKNKFMLITLPNEVESHRRKIAENSNRKLKLLNYYSTVRMQFESLSSPMSTRRRTQTYFVSVAETVFLFPQKIITIIFKGSRRINRGKLGCWYLHKSTFQFIISAS